MRGNQSATGRAPRWSAILVTTLMVAPAVAAIVCLAGRHWWPADDYAIIDLRVRDVFTANTPLTGLYSRPGWNHPGPLMFWAMAPLSELSGHASWATRIGGAVMQAVALVWLGIATARHSLRLLLGAGLVVSMTFLASNQWLFREPWNLHIPVPYFVMFLFVTHLVAIGRFRHLIGMAVAGTVMVSTHVSYAPLVLFGFAYATGWAIVDARRSGRLPERWRSTVLLALAVWFVTWSAPLLDVALHWPGNLGRVTGYFLESAHRTLGLSAASRLMADEFRWVPPWLGGAHRVTALGGLAIPAPAPWLLIALGIAGTGAAAVWRSRNREDGRMLGFAVLLVGVAVYAISNADDARAYTFQWRAIVASFLVATSSLAVSTVMRTRASRQIGAIATAGAVGLVALGSGAMTIAVIRRSSGPSIRGPEVEKVMQVVDRHPLPKGPVRIRAVGWSIPGLYDGVVDELARRGVDVRVDPVEGRIFGSKRTISPTVRTETWYVTQEGSLTPGLLARPGARLLVATSPLRPAEETELARLQAAVGRALDRAGLSERRADLDSTIGLIHLGGIPGITKAQLDRLLQLNTKVGQSGRCRCAVVVVRP